MCTFIDNLPLLIFSTAEDKAIQISPGKDMQALINGKSTQVPMLPIVNIGKSKVCRKLSIGSRTLVYEKN